jgi:hypothetical protein
MKTIFLVCARLIERRFGMAPRRERKPLAR